MEGLDNADDQDDLEGVDAENSLHALQDEPDALGDGCNGAVMALLLWRLRANIPGLNPAHSNKDPRREGKARDNEEDDPPPLQASFQLVTCGSSEYSVRGLKHLSAGYIYILK